MRRHFRRSEETEKRIESERQPEEDSKEYLTGSDAPQQDVVDQPGTNLFGFEQDVINDLRTRWNSIQAQFVDQPCTSIEQADALIADALDRIHQMLTDQQEILRERWYNHEDVSTEDLRITLQDYRTFLNNLLDQ
jgi:hypothetical protein